MPPGMLTVLLLAQYWAASALLLSPDRVDPVRLLVFGDSWGALGPTWISVRDMFNRHGVENDVKSFAINGIRSCQMASTPVNLKRAIDSRFPGTGADFVWFTLGANDLFEPDYIYCARQARGPEEATECLLMKGRESHKCMQALLDVMWDAYPDVRVFQCSYDLPCTEGACVPQSTLPFCATNSTCINELSLVWQRDLCDAMNSYNWSAGSGKYTCAHITGALQHAADYPGTSVGHPDTSRSTPCVLLDSCTHPHREGLATWAIGEAFWDVYFRDRVTPTKAVLDVPKPPMPSPANSSDVWEGSEMIDTYCNYKWTPSLEEFGERPPCD